MVLAMAGFASMDAASKWMVKDYSVAQLMWIRYGFYCAFVAILVRRAGILQTARTRRPWLQATRIQSSAQHLLLSRPVGGGQRAGATVLVHCAAAY